MKITYTVIAGFPNCYLTLSDELISTSEDPKAELEDYINKTYFAHHRASKLPVFDVQQWDVDADFVDEYAEALTAGELFDLLKLTRQQLHYYVKIGTIRKVYNPEKPKQFKYNKNDAEALYVKLKAKYIKHTM
jgi:hypothetical protein